jgi:hypothetical protein
MIRRLSAAALCAAALSLGLPVWAQTTIPAAPPGPSGQNVGNTAPVAIITAPGIVCDFRSGGNCAAGGGGGSGAAPVGYANQPLTTAVSVAATATQVVAARTGAAGTGRGLLILVNDTTTDAWCGPTAAVAVSSGTLLVGVKGASINVPYTGAEYCISTSGTILVSVTELY